MPYCHHIILLYLFAKNDMANLSAQTRKQLAKHEGGDQMSGQAKKRRVSTARKSGPATSGRAMTDKESSDLLESASQALAMITGSKLVGGRIACARRRLNHGHEIRGI
jgi:hypothetical protein